MLFLFTFWLAGCSLIVLSSGSERIYTFVGEIVWVHESLPLLSASHLVAIQKGMLKETPWLAFG